MLQNLSTGISETPTPKLAAVYGETGCIINTAHALVLQSRAVRVECAKVVRSVAGQQPRCEPPRHLVAQLVCAGLHTVRSAKLGQLGGTQTEDARS